HKTRQPWLRKEPSLPESRRWHRLSRWHPLTAAPRSNQPVQSGPQRQLLRLSVHRPLLPTFVPVHASRKDETESHLSLAKPDRVARHSGHTLALVDTA